MNQCLICTFVWLCLSKRLYDLKGFAGAELKAHSHGSSEDSRFSCFRWVCCFPAGVSGSLTQDCSYHSLLKHFNLTTSNEVIEMVRPVRNWTSTTLIQLDMLLFGILDVDEKFQTVTNYVWIQMKWTNEFLRWNSSEFCGIDSLTLPRSKLWIPDVAIQQDASDTGSIQEDPLVRLNPSGLVLAGKRQRLTYTCQLNLSLFPFDVQHCNITFSTLSSDGRFVKLTTFSNDAVLTSVSMKILMTQGEWKLQSMKVLKQNLTNEQTFSSNLVYMVTLERKPMLFVVNLIMPLFFLLVLDLASFFISEARGEKLGFKVTVLLSVSVLLLILQEILPSTEDDLPAIAQYFVGVFTMMWMSTLETMAVSFIMDLDGCCGKKAQSSVDANVDIQLEEHVADEDKDVGKTEESRLPSDPPDDCDLLKLILDKVKAVRQEAEHQDKDKTKPGRFRKLAKIIDTVFFVLYILVIATFLMYMYMLWRNLF
ncbi:5-hydroxytryptamine receptor 3A-like isoform X1 [Odontesthes bonariensis]|uniref:5-hydroxytryptamine receptor 3A-like isoform X1 n=1 Tax=Odontesthes bonariensis TaxID=219752 RepID=UPI003F5873BA